MIETEDDDHVTGSEIEDKSEETSSSQKDTKIAELIALVAEQKQLLATNAKHIKELEKKKPIEILEAAEVAKIVAEHDNKIIEYDAVDDKVVTKNEKEFNRILELHCKSKKDKEINKILLKNQVLQKVRKVERSKLGLKPTRGRSFVRGRSEESDSESGSVKSLRLSSSQPILKNSK